MATRPDGAIPRRAMATYHDFLRSLLSDRDRFFEEVVEGVGLRSKLRYAVVTIVALSGFFGLVAGAYSGPAQAASAAVKLPFLFFATFAVCFPAFFVVQVLVGSRLRLLQVAVLVFGALALACVLLAAFVPITAFLDRKSTRLNSSHGYISYAVFCLKKKKKQICRVTRIHVIVDPS